MLSSEYLPNPAGVSNAVARRQTSQAARFPRCICQALQKCQMQPQDDKLRRVAKFSCLPYWQPAVSCVWANDLVCKSDFFLCGFVETAGGANQEYGTRRLVRGEGNAFPVHTGGRTVWQMNASAKSGGNFYCTLSLLKRGSACQKTFREGEPRRTSVAAGKQ